MDDDQLGQQTNRHVVVTGATGFVGQHLVPILLANNYRVTAIARDAQKAAQFPWSRDVEFVACDLGQEVSTLEVDPDAGLIHLAWPGLPNYKDLFHIEENVPLSYNLVKHFVANGCQQVLVTGTCFEFGFQSGPITADAVPQPNNPYAIAKDCLRQYLEQLAKHTEFCLQWPRLFYMYGAGQNPRSVLPQLDAAIDKGEPVFNMSGGEQLRDFLPIEAVAQQLFDIYEHKRAGTINVCSGTPISVRRLVEDHIKARGAEIELNLGHYPYPDYEPMAFWGVPDDQ